MRQRRGIGPAADRQHVDRLDALARARVRVKDPQKNRWQDEFKASAAEAKHAMDRLGISPRFANKESAEAAQAERDEILRRSLANRAAARAIVPTSLPKPGSQNAVQFPRSVVHSEEMDAEMERVNASFQALVWWQLPPVFAALGATRSPARQAVTMTHRGYTTKPMV